MIFIVMAVFICLAIGLAWFLIVHDYGPKEPIFALWVAVACGIVGVTAAFFLEGWLLPKNTLSSTNSGSFGTFLTVGAIEESCKFVLLAIFIYKRDYFNEYTDGIIYFALAGMAFGLPENIRYTVLFGSKVGLSRILLTPVFHAATTSMVGYFLAMIKMKKRHVVWVVIPFAAAILLHALYDFGTASTKPLLQALAYFITFGLAANMFILFFRATQHDQSLGLSRVGGRNNFCRSCGSANPKRYLYCTHCGKNA